MLLTLPHSVGDCEGLREGLREGVTLPLPVTVELRHWEGVLVGVALLLCVPEPL